MTSSFDLMEWFPEECYWTGLTEAPSSTREFDRAVFLNINGESVFSQPRLKVDEV